MIVCHNLTHTFCFIIGCEDHQFFNFAFHTNMLCEVNFAIVIFQVIVKDIVTKNVVAQFRAHKSPISALCFDPSGTILVTASVQGHNINVFKIMPLRENSSAYDAGPSHVHLYRLQRGFTNAVSAYSFSLIL